MARAAGSRIVLLALALVVLVGAGGAWWWQAIGRWPVAGDLTHDFGTVPITGFDVSLDHEFALRNRRDVALKVVRLVPSCGCTSVEADRDVIEPGETLRVATTLVLSKAGLRKSHVDVLLERADDGEIEKVVLWVAGRARKERELVLPPAAPPLAAGEAVRLVMQAHVQSSDARPAEPTFESPSAVAVRFGGWTKMTDRDPGTGHAARWRGIVFLTWDGTPVDPARAVLAVTLGDAQPVRVALVTKAVDAPPSGITPLESFGDAPGEIESTIAPEAIESGRSPFDVPPVVSGDGDGDGA